MFNNSALYYPYIDFRDVSWLKAMSMFYEKVFRIVPDGVETNDPHDLVPLIESEAIGQQIDPARYAERASVGFLEKLNKWDAAALSASSDEESGIARIHHSKTDQQVRDLFKTLGYPETGDWWHVPTDLASNYMLFLAREIALNNNLSLITS